MDAFINFFFSFSTSHTVLCGLLLGSSIIVIMSTSPINSVLGLIFSFFFSAGILFLHHAEFLALILVIIYVGAVAVLFLFVLMMINVKVRDPIKEKVAWITACNVILFFALLNIIFNTFGWEYSDPTRIRLYVQNVLMLDELNNLDLLGQVLFNYYLIAVLLAGIVLLVALIGSIILTLDFKKSQKRQYIFKQLSRSDNSLSFFKASTND